MGGLNWPSKAARPPDVILNETGSRRDGSLGFLGGHGLYFVVWMGLRYLILPPWSLMPLPAFHLLYFNTRRCTQSLMCPQKGERGFLLHPLCCENAITFLQASRGRLCALSLLFYSPCDSQSAVHLALACYQCLFSTMCQGSCCWCQDRRTCAGVQNSGGILVMTCE